MSAPKLHVTGTILGYQRSKKNQYPQWSLIELDGVRSKEEAAWYLGKKIAYVYRAKKAKKTEEKKKSRLRVIWGRICSPHGANGVVKARFTSNLPPISFGAPVRCFLYPNRF